MVAIIDFCEEEAMADLDFGENNLASGCQVDWKEKDLEAIVKHMLQHQEHPGYSCRTETSEKRAVFTFAKSLLFGNMASNLSILIQAFFYLEISPDQFFPNPHHFCSQEENLVSVHI